MRLGKGRALPIGDPIDGLLVVTLIAATGLLGAGGILRSAQNEKLRKAGRRDNQKALGRPNDVTNGGRAVVEPTGVAFGALDPFLRRDDGGVGATKLGGDDGGD